MSRYKIKRSSKLLRSFGIRVVVMLLAVTMLLPVSFFSAIAETGFVTTLEGLTGLQGTWNETAEGMYSSGSGDCFAMSSSEAVDFIYEADIKIGNNGAASLVFRSSNDGKQSYVANIDKGKNNARIFRFNASGGATTLGELVLPESLYSLNNFNLRVEVIGSSMKYYLNGVLAVACKDTTYTSGKLGLLTYNATVTYQNVKHTVLDNNTLPKLNELKLSDGTLSPAYDATELSYEAVVSFTTESVKVTPTAEENSSISISAVDSNGSVMLNATQVDSGKTSADINLPVGLSYINIRVKNESEVELTYTVSIERKQDSALMYREKYRPQLHFTSEKNWINDPNGLVYDNGEYHMFYQYNPYGLNIGNQAWGHAVSTDLINWTELPVAVKPDELGVIYSGCAVVDEENTSGFFTDNTPDQSKLVIIFTHHGGDETHGREKQSIAYSKDHGRTWIKYEGNPVIPNDNNKYGGDFRDPKVFRHDGKWLMIIAGGRARIFSSDNLIDWSLESELFYKDGNQLHSECPDLFPLAVDGDENNIKWVYTGSGKFYVIGDLVLENGKYVFRATSDRIEPYNGGSEMYATQSFYNDGSGKNRRMLVSWMQDSSAGELAGEGKTWNGVQSLPLVTELRTINGEIRLTSYAPEEINEQRALLPMYEIENKIVNEQSDNILKDVTGEKYDIEATFTLGSATEFGFNLRTGNNQKTVVKYNRETNRLTFDRSNSGKVLGGSTSLKLTPDGNKITLRIIVDTSVIDIFGNKGEAAINTLFFPEPTSVGMEFFAVGGDVTIDTMEIYQMKSIYHDDLEITVPMVEKIISDLPDEITLEHENQVEDAQAEFEKLSVEEQNQVKAELVLKLQTATLRLEFLKNGLPGDLNGDKELTVSDIVALRKLIMDSEPLSAEQLMVGDLNEDGALTVSDIVALRKLIMS